jgi:hypothetical protein
MKDIVTEGNTINIEKFIPTLSQRVRVLNPECRKVISNILISLSLIDKIEFRFHSKKLFILVCDWLDCSIECSS